MERRAFDAHEKVDGIAGVAGVGADPVVVFDNDVLGKTDHHVIVVSDGVEPVSEAFEDGLERGLTGAANLRAVPDHGLYGSVMDMCKIVGPGPEGLATDGLARCGARPCRSLYLRNNISG